MNLEIRESENTVKLLWTGGWDSTFRLLEVVLKEKKEVQPYYIIFKDRWSYKKEMETMDNIKSMIHKNYPQATDLIHDTFFIEEDGIIENDHLVQTFQKIKAKINIGTQYKTIVSFANQFQLEDLELGLLKNGKTYNEIEPYIFKKDANSPYRVVKDRAPDEIYNFYKYFTFPLFEYSNKDMVEILSTNKWQSILDEIWICHKPIFGKYACGGCNPCLLASRDKLKKNRIPLISRIIGPLLKKVYNSKFSKRLF